MSGGQEEQILDLLLERLKERGWLQAGGKQRTDSTHVLAAICSIGRLMSCFCAMATQMPKTLKTDAEQVKIFP